MKTKSRIPALCLLSAAVLATIAACGGGDTPVPLPPPVVTYTVGGTVSGLSGSGLALENNGGDDLAVSATGPFSFAKTLVSGAKYAVTVKTQPSSPVQSCVVGNDSGTVGSTNVTNVTVTCTTPATVTVGGTVTGLTGVGLALNYNDSVNPPVQLAVSASGTFTFPSAVVQGSSYQVTVGTEPSSPVQNCVVTNGSGVVGSENISNISIACSGVGRFAYVANAGDDSISVYSIDPTTGALTAVGTPVPTGASPYAIVASPDGLHLYVVNESSNDISAYLVDAVSGTLSEIAGSPFATGTDPQALAFDPTGAYLYVANNGSNNLSAFGVDPITGALSSLPIATYATGSGPSAISVDRAGKFVFVANNGGSNDISGFAITAGAGALTPVPGSPFAAGPPFSPDISPLSLVFIESSVFYGLCLTAYDPYNGLVVPFFSVDNATGALTFASGWLVAVDNYIATDRNGEVLYGATRGGLVGYGISDASGDLTTLPGYPYASGRNAYSVTVDPSNQFLYVPNEGAGTISGFVRNPDGSLTAISGGPFASGHYPVFIAII
ncbi:MAG: beta-propeller fold lactonase family protein [Proteobacteria bacterium]|nr:beta-propeller fold lactonase family protein [Pseudomonadota bacterium]